MTKSTTTSTDELAGDVEARLAALEAYTRPVTEAEVDAFSEEFEGDPLGDLAHGGWHPSSPVEVAFALSLLAQEVNLAPPGAPAPEPMGDVEASVAALGAPVEATAGEAEARLALDASVGALRPKYLPIIEALQSIEATIVGIDRSWFQVLEEMNDADFGADGALDDALRIELLERCGFDEASVIGDRIVEMITRRGGGAMIPPDRIPDPADSGSVVSSVVVSSVVDSRTR